MSDRHPRLVLAVGAEAAGLTVPDGLVAASPGRALAEAVESLAANAPTEGGAGPVVVIPMTFGREPSLVADAARTLRDVRDRLGPGSVCLSEPIGDPGALVAYLRSAIRRHPEATAVLVTSPSIDPFADAELFRVARLARQYGSPHLVDVAFDGGAEPDPDLDAGLRRSALLGAPEPMLVPAGFGAAPVVGRGLLGEGATLLGAATLRSLVDTRARSAAHALHHREDGIDSGLDAEDGHGYAHSHVAADGTVYTHSH